MRSVIKGIILGIFLSFVFSPLTVHASAYKPVTKYIAYSMEQGVKNHPSYIVISPDNNEYGYVTEMPSGESWWDVWSNYGQGWWEIEEELNKYGIYLDENGMIMDGTVYTMPK